MLRKKFFRLLGLAALALGLALLLGACGTEHSGAGGETSGDAVNIQEAKALSPGESLVIPTDELTEAASFYPVQLDGVAMEVLAVKVDGEVRTAFNTCQVCNGSPYAYFEQKGSVVECQNCRNQFPMSRVGVEAGGCNPWPIFAEDRTDADGNINISYDFLSANKEIFGNWKNF